MNIKKHWKSFTLTFFALALSLGGFALAETEWDYFYLSPIGFIVKLDVDKVAESGQVAAGKMPWSAAACGGHIYFSDFGSDSVYDFSPKEKTIAKLKIEELGASREIDLVSKDDPNAKQSMLRGVFSKIHPSKKQTLGINALDEPLPVASHNKHFGLGQISCNDKQVFVVSSLKNHVEILDTTKGTLKHFATLDVGKRPAFAVPSPDGNQLAVSCTADDEVYFVSLPSLEKTNIVKVGHGPTDLVWLTDNKLAVLNRADESVTFLSGNGALLGEVKPGGPINHLSAARGRNALLALNGAEGKLNAIDQDTLKFESMPIGEDLKYASFISERQDNKQIVIGSEKDGRLIVFDLETKAPIRRIQTNLPPRILVHIER